MPASLTHWVLCQLKLIKNPARWQLDGWNGRECQEGHAENVDFVRREGFQSNLPHHWDYYQNRGWRWQFSLSVWNSCSFFKGCGEGSCTRAALHSKELVFLLSLSPPPFSFHEEQFLPSAQGCWPEQAFGRRGWVWAEIPNKMRNGRWFRQAKREGNSADPKQQQKVRSSFTAETFLRIETQPEVLDVKVSMNYWRETNHRAPTSEETRPGICFGPMLGFQDLSPRNKMLSAKFIPLKKRWKAPTRDRTWSPGCEKFPQRTRGIKITELQRPREGKQDPEFALGPTSPSRASKSFKKQKFTCL